MKSRKRLLLVVIIPLGLVSVVVLTSLFWVRLFSNDMLEFTSFCEIITKRQLEYSDFAKIFSKESLEYSDFCGFIKRGSCDKLNLTIYYLDSGVHYEVPLSEADLANNYDYKIIVNDGYALSERADMLNQMSDIVLTPLELWPRMDARWSYIFESKLDGRKLRITMNDLSASMYVNGHEVEQSRVFVDFLISFLPEKEAQELLEELDNFDYELDKLETLELLNELNSWDSN